MDISMGQCIKEPFEGHAVLKNKLKVMYILFGYPGGLSYIYKVNN